MEVDPNSIMPTGFAALPTVVLEEIFSHLAIKELMVAEQVCKTWNCILNQKRFSRREFWIKKMNNEFIKSGKIPYRMRCRWEQFMHQCDDDLRDHPYQDEVLKVLKKSSILLMKCIEEQGTNEISLLRNFTHGVEWTIKTEEDFVAASAALFFLNLIPYKGPISLVINLIKKLEEITNIELFAKMVQTKGLTMVPVDVTLLSKCGKSASFCHSDNIISFLSVARNRCALKMQ